MSLARKTISEEEKNIRAFYLEEYKQLRAEVTGQISRVELLFRYSLIVFATVSAWLATNSLGLVADTTKLCLKLPIQLALLGWLIPPFFVAGAGFLAEVMKIRGDEIGDYLLEIESFLGQNHASWKASGKLPARSEQAKWAMRLEQEPFPSQEKLGWEKFLASKPPSVTKQMMVLWELLFATAVIVSGVAIVVTNTAVHGCPSK